MVNIIIYGCGGIGQRYAEACANLKNKISLFLYDPDQAKLDLLETHILEKNKNILIKKNFHSLPNIDLLIIATNSKPRFDILENVINNTTVNAVILEKFLFTRLNEYDRTKHMLNKKNITCYVSTWMHIPFGFQVIGQSFLASNDKNLKIYGDGFGIGCNSVHFISLFDFIIQKGTLNLLDANISQFRKSKRDGYFDIDGSILVEKDGYTLEIISRNKPASGIISFDSATVSAEFELGSVTFFDNSRRVEKKISVPTLSEIMYTEIHSLIENGISNLTKFDRSLNHHILIFEGFSKELALTAHREGFSQNRLIFT